MQDQTHQIAMRNNQRQAMALVQEVVQALPSACQYLPGRFSTRGAPVPIFKGLAHHVPPMGNRLRRKISLVQAGIDLDGQPQSLRQGFDALLSTDVGAGYNAVNRRAGKKLGQFVGLYRTGISQRGVRLLPRCFAVPDQNELAHEKPTARGTAQVFLPRGSWWAVWGSNPRHPD